MSSLADWYSSYRSGVAVDGPHPGRDCRARDSLVSYCEATYPGYLVPRHIREIADRLEAVERGEIDRLLIVEPPRHGKSLTVSQRFPAWFMGRNPSAQLLHVSYAQSLVTSFGRRVRNLMASEEHAEIFPAATLSRDARAAAEWETPAGGVYKAVGVGAGITGRGADCIAAGTLVATPVGDIPIENIQAGMIVYSCEDNQRVARRVIARRAAEADDMVRVVTEAGRRVEATGDHRFHVPGVGWIEARNLAPGQPVTALDVPPAVRRVRRGGREDALRTQEMGAHGVQPGVQNDGLLGRASGAHGSVQGVREAVQAQDGPEALFAGLCRGLEPEVDGSEDQAQRLLQEAPSPARAGQGRPRVRHLRQSACAPRAPHRRGLVEQRDVEPDHAVQHVPREAPPLAGDRILRVERAGGGAVEVHDIQVEGAACFFAGGLLAHNCLIIDDAVRGHEDADSETIRDSVWDFYRNDALTRLLPNGRVIVIGTRWHEQDLIGRLLEAQETGGDRWTVLHHPALNAAGEALWPERYPVESLNRIRAAVGPRAWQSLYQGEPTREEGTYFKKRDFNLGQPPPVDVMRVIGASDYALTQDGGDYSVNVVVGVDPEGRLWLLDVWRRQTTPDRWVASMLDMVSKWKPVVWAGERGVILKSVGPFISAEMKRRNVYCRVEGFTSATDKPTRARAIQGRIANGGLWMPSGSHWIGEVQSELLAFPTGKHDDVVDALSLVGRLVEYLDAADDPRRSEPVREGFVTFDQLRRGTGAGLSGTGQLAW